MQEQEYATIIRYISGEFDVIVRSFTFEECEKVWQERVDHWVSSSKEQKPFILTKPKFIALSPVQIASIEIIPVPKRAEQTSRNPYVQQQEQEGLGSMIQRYSQQSPILDQGYKI